MPMAVEAWPTLTTVLPAPGVPTGVPASSNFA